MKETEDRKESSDDESVEIFKKVDSSEVFSDKKIMHDQYIPEQVVVNSIGVSTFAKKR